MLTTTVTCTVHVRTFPCEKLSDSYILFLILWKVFFYLNISKRIQLLMRYDTWDERDLTLMSVSLVFVTSLRMSWCIKNITDCTTLKTRAFRFGLFVCLFVFLNSSDVFMTQRCVNIYLEVSFSHTSRLVTLFVSLFLSYCKIPGLI